MNIFECWENITLCYELYVATPCSPSLIGNHCMDSHGTCYVNKEDPRMCVCSPCFTGGHCETELSGNLWKFGMLFNEDTAHLNLVDTIVGYIFGVVLLLNGFLCLQTYLCREIRQTNLGIYLTMLSIVTILTGFLHFMSVSIYLYLTYTDFGTIISANGINCHYRKYVEAQFSPVFNWFTAAVAVERVLVECSTKYSLHDSRHRSVIFSVFIVIVCTISISLSGTYTVRDHLSPELQSTYCLDFTPVGYIIYETIKSIYLSAYYLVYILMNVVVLIKLVRRRQRFVDSNSLLDQLGPILSRHKDFFIPYLVHTTCLLPGVIMDYIMTCPKAGTLLVIYTHLICNVLELLPFALTFYLYVSLSPVYLAVFWDSSPVGRLLVRMKVRLLFFVSIHM